MNIKLNLVNQSNDDANTPVVIFQQNQATGFIEPPIAWKVIKNCGQGDNHPFVFPMQMQVGGNDSYGNFTPLQNAAPGQAFEMTLTSEGDVLRAAGDATSPAQVQVRNDLSQGAIGASIYKDGRKLALNPVIVPQHLAAFQFKPTIWVGAVAQVNEGEVLDSAILSEVDTELHLSGVSSADIVMRGGGSGAQALPFTFSLENVVMA